MLNRLIEGTIRSFYKSTPIQETKQC